VRAHDALASRWADLTSDLGCAREPAESLGGELVARYEEPHRHYHTDRHLLAVLEALDELSHPERPTPAQRLAAWFHDAVYTGSTPTDEETSARLAEQRLSSLELGDSLVESVVSMVMATARHLDPTADHDPDTSTFLDADLSILAADETTYDSYCDGVRREHSTVPEERFVAGRRAVVEALLAREHLYLTARGQERYDQAARANLRRELAALRSAP
jgi:predicted metal-dependent HD superfamily phosphohydrolase